MKKIFKLILAILLFVPFMVFADGNGPTGPDLYVKVINDKGIYLDCDSDEDYDDEEEDYEENYQTVEEYCEEYLEEEEYSGYMEYFDDLDDFDRCVKEVEYSRKVHNNCKNGAYHVEKGEAGILEFTEEFDSFNGFRFYESDHIKLNDFAPVEETYSNNHKTDIRIPAYVFDKTKILAGPSDLYKKINEISFTNIEVNAYEEVNEGEIYTYIKDYDNEYISINYIDAEGYASYKSIFYKATDYEEYFNEDNIEIILGKDLVVKNINDENDTKVLPIKTNIKNKNLYVNYYSDEFYYFDGTYYGKIKYYSSLNKYEKTFTLAKEVFFTEDLTTTVSNDIIPAETTLTSLYYDYDFGDYEEWFTGSFYVNYNGKDGWVHFSFENCYQKDYFLKENLGFEDYCDEDDEYEYIYDAEDYETIVKYKTYYLVNTGFKNEVNILGEKAYVNINIKDKDTEKIYSSEYINGGYVYLKNKTNKITKLKLNKDENGFYIETNDIKKGKYKMSSLMLFVDNVKYIYTSDINESKYIYYEFPYEVSFKNKEVTAKTEKKEYSVKDILIYCGIGAVIISLTAIVTVLLVNKKKKLQVNNNTQTINQPNNVQNTNVVNQNENNSK